MNHLMDHLIWMQVRNRIIIFLTNKATWLIRLKKKWHSEETCYGIDWSYKKKMFFYVKSVECRCGTCLMNVSPLSRRQL